MLEHLMVPTGILLSLAPHAFFCYIPFSKQIKFSKKIYFFVFSAIFTVQFFINTLLYYCRVIGVYELFYISLAVCCAAFCVSVKANLRKVLFVFLILATYESVLVATSCLIKAQIYPFIDDSRVYSVPYIITHSLLLLYTSPILYLLLYRYIRPLINLKNVKFWNTLWVIPFTFEITLYIIIGLFEDRLVIYWQYAIVCAILSGGSIIIYYLIAKMLIETDENAGLREHVRMTAHQLILQEEQYKRLNEHIAEIREARHDLRHHLSVIDSYVQTNDIQRLRDYLKDYKCSLPEDSELALCENYAVNAIVNHYIGLARQEGITVTAKLQIPIALNIVDSDLCIVLGNCLENASEACRRMKDGQRYIRLHAEVVGSMLIMTIDNSFDGLVKEKGGIFYSLKRDKSNTEGVGLSSVRAVAQKYRGTVQFTYTATEYRSSIMLQENRVL